MWQGEPVPVFATLALDLSAVQIVKHLLHDPKRRAVGFRRNLENSLFANVRRIAFEERDGRCQKDL